MPPTPPSPYDATRHIELSEAECEEIREALACRHMLIIDDMWDTTSYARVDRDVRSLRAIVTAIRKMWAVPGRRTLVEDRAHTLGDETEYQVSERRRSLDATNHII